MEIRKPDRGNLEAVNDAARRPAREVPEQTRAMAQAIIQLYEYCEDLEKLIAGGR